MLLRNSYKLPAVEWLYLIQSERLRNQALDSLANCPGDPMAVCTSIDEAIFQAFEWEKTSQGEAYWLNIYNSKIALKKPVHAREQLKVV